MQNVMHNNGAGDGKRHDNKTMVDVSGYEIKKDAAGMKCIRQTEAVPKEPPQAA